MDFSENSYYRTLVDAIPTPVFVVDAEVRVHDLNAAALEFCGQAKEAVYQQRGGEVLHCLHSLDVPEGCGKAPFCENCVIRSSVTACLQGQKASRQRMRMELVHGDSRQPMELLITTSPMPDCGLALLILEDVTELLSLRTLLPICMKCKKIRDDEQYWRDVEDYFHQHMRIDFSHGLCPACVKLFYAEYAKPPRP